MNLEKKRSKVIFLMGYIAAFVTRFNVQIGFDGVKEIITAHQCFIVSLIWETQTIYIFYIKRNKNLINYI